MRNGHWKKQTKGDVVELYDLSKDIKETTNVADKYPKCKKIMEGSYRKVEAGGETGNKRKGPLL
jgi:arylsulfatase A